MFKTTAILFAIFRLGISVPDIFTLLYDHPGDVPECVGATVASCRKVKVNFDLVSDKVFEVIFPEGHIMTRNTPIAVYSEVHKASFEVSVYFLF